MSEPIEEENTGLSGEGIVCPECGHSTWLEGKCFNPLCDENPTFEPAVKVSPTSKATQTIIPGAAYLSPREDRVYVGVAGGLLLSSDWTDENEFFAPTTPADMVLLYAPGDKVESYQGWTHEHSTVDIVEIMRPSNA